MVPIVMSYLCLSLKRCKVYMMFALWFLCLYGNIMVHSHLRFITHEFLCKLLRELQLLIKITELILELFSSRNSSRNRMCQCTHLELNIYEIVLSIVHA